MTLQNDIDKVFKPVQDNQEIDELKEDLRIVKFQLQEINDKLSGRLSSKNIGEYRNTMVFNDWGSLDASNDFIMDFEILDEMTEIIQVKVCFKIRDYFSPVTL